MDEVDAKKVELICDVIDILFTYLPDEWDSTLSQQGHKIMSQWAVFRLEHKENN